MSYWFSGPNHLKSAAWSVSSLAPGVVGHPVKAGAGLAAMYAEGQYQGLAERVYTVEVDSTTAGAGLGQATFRWRRSDSLTPWEATGLATASSFADLDHGVRIMWVAGAAPDFAVGDAWTFLATPAWGPARLADADRDTVYRSAGLDGPNWLAADLGQARRVTALVLLDHNLTEAAQLTIEADDGPDWSSPELSLDVAWTPGTVVRFLDATHRHWRLVVDDPDNPAGFVECSELFLGQGLEAALCLESGAERGLDAAAVGLLPRAVFKGEFTAPTAAVRDALVSWYRELVSASGRPRRQPFFFCADRAEPAANTWLMSLAEAQLRWLPGRRDDSRFPLNLVEEPKSHV